MSCVNWQMSPVMCHVSHIFIIFLQSCGANRWRVCYRRGLPRLVCFNVDISDIHMYDQPNRKLQNVLICAYSLGTFCGQIFIPKVELTERYIYLLSEQRDFAKEDLLSTKIGLKSRLDSFKYALG